MFKVGKTERSVEERMGELTADTSNIGTYVAEAFFVVTNVDAAEKACHRRLNRYRVQPNREFFELELDRLVLSVEEETKPFSANDLVPEISREEAASDKKSSLQKIQALQKGRANAKEQFEQTCQEAEIDLERSFPVVHERLAHIREELRDLKCLSWHIPSSFEEAKNAHGRIEMGSVIFHSSFSGEAPVLEISDIRGDIYSEPDLSRAVSEPEVWSTHGNAEFIKWREKDDGRYGRVEISGNVDARQNESGAGKVELRFLVRAECIQYDDYKTSWKSRHGDRQFTNIEEALDAFEELIVLNAAAPVVDVRTMGEMSSSRRGKSYQKVRDRGYSFFKNTPQVEDI